MQKIVQSMIKGVTDSFKKNQILLNPEGGNCMLRFDVAAEAKKFVNLYNSSVSIFGDKY